MDETRHGRPLAVDNKAESASPTEPANASPLRNSPARLEKRGLRTSISGRRKCRSKHPT
jgi:hypothetical protein